MQRQNHIAEHADSCCGASQTFGGGQANIPLCQNAQAVFHFQTDEAAQMNATGKITANQDLEMGFVDGD